MLAGQTVDVVVQLACSVVELHCQNQQRPSPVLRYSNHITDMSTSTTSHSAQKCWKLRISPKHTYPQIFTHEYMLSVTALINLPSFIKCHCHLSEVPCSAVFDRAMTKCSSTHNTNSKNKDAKVIN